jgi:hypothetical protein
MGNQSEETETEMHIDFALQSSAAAQRSNIACGISINLVSPAKAGWSSNASTRRSGSNSCSSSDSPHSPSAYKCASDRAALFECARLVPPSMPDTSKLGRS